MSDEHPLDDPVDADGPRRLNRRRFLQVSGATAAAVGGGLAATGTASAAESRLARSIAPHSGHGSEPKVAVPGASRPATVPHTLTATPIRPPAAPLVVRSPYLSTWQESTVGAGTWETHWNGNITALGGIARIDGAAYMLAGDPTISLTVPDGGYVPPGQTGPEVIADFEAALDQTSLALTATRTVYTLQGGGVQITLEYLSPVEPGDLRRQSIPMSYVLVSAQSIDGSAHEVSVYLDISGEWLSGDATQPFTWTPATVPYPRGTLQAWTLELAKPRPLTETNDRANWGTVVWATPQVPGLSYQSGASASVRAQFVDQGTLTGANLAGAGSTTISDDGAFPVFGFSLDLGRVGGAPSLRQFSLGQVRTPLVSYLGQPLAPLWTQSFSSWQTMLAFFHADRPAASRRATALDAKITADAHAAGGAEYEALCVLGLRQAYGATELAVGPGGTPWAYLKEISSDGDINTVDIIYPGSPVWIYLDPQYLALLLAPIFAYAGSGRFTEPYSPHDLGHYPQATGYPLPGTTQPEEAMPVEESGNMLIMVAAYAQAAGAGATPYLQANYRLLKQWADYLVSQLPDPGFQNQTDDFAGEIAHSVNLALKGIVGVAAMSQIAEAVGQSTPAAHYAAQARSFIVTWLARAQDPSGTHLDLTYNGSGDGNGTWGTTYNAFADALLGTRLVPESVAAEQAAYYLTVSNQFGLPLQLPHSYAKSDWELWTAAWLHRYPIARQLIARVYLYANTTETRVPFSDLYSTISAQATFSSPFRARPAQGGMFSLLAVQALRDARSGAGARRNRRRPRRALSSRRPARP